ncbi:hypothetical protein [Pseudomonas syringae]|uniref:hypothetical protein n=1 Tax=Pseudomonas TaxID=286 RepID=UPI0004669B60|nr:hypothetical protein [Pseudomonas syringae]MCH5498800.1 hypothetical protein [Pseudomonas syringae pv. syringae]MCH5525173.1 hypothetical protein [Pseudomonas syringae pv. syringae]MCH5560175.1 hypothetical protein [Pseudomonas syringae pv. syringae]MCH5565350.1 hypothetical protein [Pseudomonas syringae pv. syringae]MCH5580580.1 hypothetical protein [Pseudomonas syringae pv. syringae]
MIHGERAQAFQVGADAVADLAGLDLGPGQFRVGGVTQTGDIFLPLIAPAKSAGISSSRTLPPNEVLMLSR